MGKKQLGQVRVDPDKLEEAADSISRNREAMEKIIRELLQVTFELQMSWEGMAHQRFFDEFFSKKRSMDDLVKHLKHTELELKKAAKTFREVDEKAYGDFNLLDKLSDAYLRGSARAAGDTIFDPLKKAGNQVTDFFGHLVDDPMDTLEDAKYGLRDFAESSIDEKKEEVKDKYEFIKALWNDPSGTLKSEWDEEVQEMYAIRNVLSDWYVKNVEYGDAESITESIAYGVTSFAFLAVGTKGAGALSNGVRWGRDLSRMSSYHMGNRWAPAYGGESYFSGLGIKAKDTHSSIVGNNLGKGNISRQHDYVAHNSYYSAKEFRTKLNNAQYSEHGHKHIKAKTKEQTKLFSETGRKQAQYLPSVDNGMLEKEALQKGLIYKDKDKGAIYFFYQSAETIGYDLGKEATWIRAELNDSWIYHGHPMNDDRVKEYLKSALTREEFFNTHFGSEK